MAEFTPNVPDGPFTSTLSAHATAGQCLVVSGDNTVAPSSGASVAYVGIAAFDAKSGDKITLLNEGNFTLAASGAIAAGELVTTAASGAVATQGTASAANDVQVIGVALSAAASSKVKVRIFR
jgi:hypothetical protein